VAWPELGEFVSDNPLERFKLDGRFRLQQQVGFGAQGTVYRAIDESSDEVVAVKLYDALSGSGDVLALDEVAHEARVNAEADVDTLVRIRHHGVLDRGTRQLGYIVMDYLHGETLRDLMEARSASFEVRDVMELMREVLRAVGALHDRGYVHSDLKPENIFLLESSPSEGPAVRLFDLGGVFKAGSAPRGPRRGTPIYVAPEIARRDDGVGTASDVYSLGIILFEMLVGRAPVDALATAEQIVSQHVFGQLQDLPDVLENLPVGSLYRRATARGPLDRFSTAGEMLQALVSMRPLSSQRLPAHSPFSSPSVDDSVHGEFQKFDPAQIAGTPPTSNDDG
jgi:serine/threonine protein kinase